MLALVVVMSLILRVPRVLCVARRFTRWGTEPCRLCAGHTGPIVAVSPCTGADTVAATVSLDGTLRLWDTNEWAQVRVAQPVPVAAAATTRVTIFFPSRLVAQEGFVVP